MPNNHPNDNDTLPDKTRRIESSLTSLNERIARLAMLLGAPLETEADFQKILNRETGVFQSHGADHLMGTLSVLSDEERRLQREWEELRGSLVMRCDLMAHTLEDLGLEKTRTITANVEELLERRGFKKGADGFYLHVRLNASED